jgi:hypothetical protein
MGGRHCAVHESDTAVSACKQCSKDLCKSCVMVTPAGTFCSSECSVLHRELKSHQGGPAKRSSGVGVRLVLFVLFLVAVAFAIHLLPMTKGQPYDLITRFMNK